MPRQKKERNDFPGKSRRLNVFIKKIIVESGHAKGDGSHNVRTFVDQYGGGLISYSTTQKLLNNPKACPQGQTLENLSIVLSKASGRTITPNTLASLMFDPALGGTDGMAKSLPTDDDIKDDDADTLLKNLADLPLYSRSRISGKILEMLGRDWEYFETDDLGRLKILLRYELNRKGWGIDRWVEETLKDAIDVEIIRSIHSGIEPSRSLNEDEVEMLCQNLRFFRNDQVPLDELKSLARRPK